MAGNKAYYEAVYAYFSGTTGKKGICAYAHSDTSPVTVSDYTTVTASSVDQMKAAMN